MLLVWLWIWKYTIKSTQSCWSSLYFSLYHINKNVELYDQKNGSHRKMVNMHHTLRNMSSVLKGRLLLNTHSPSPRVILFAPLLSIIFSLAYVMYHNDRYSELFCRLTFSFVITVTLFNTIAWIEPFKCWDPICNLEFIAATSCGLSVIISRRSSAWSGHCPAGSCCLKHGDTNQGHKKPVTKDVD